MSTDAPADGRTSIAVYVGTYRRNPELRRLLDSISLAADHVRDRARVAVIVVDDNLDGRALDVVEEFDRLRPDSFELGLHYRKVGGGNISLVRNEGLRTGLELAEWVAMTDDDCVAREDWLSELLSVQERTDADCVTGPCVLHVPAGSPRWLTDQPFLDEGLMSAEDGAPWTVAATHNSMVRSEWFRARPDLRFDPALGELGGEDMVLFGMAARSGMRIHFARNAVVDGYETADRATFGYRLRINYWLGNTMVVTNLALGSANRPRLLARGAKLAVTTALRPLRRLAGREAPQWRFTAALLAQAAGLILGALGVRRAHH